MKIPLDIFCVDETKLHPSFSDICPKLKGANVNYK